MEEGFGGDFETTTVNEDTNDAQENIDKEATATTNDYDQEDNRESNAIEVEVENGKGEQTNDGEGEQFDVEHLEGEHVEVEEVEGEHIIDEENEKGLEDVAEIIGEEVENETPQGGEVEADEKKEENKEVVEEEEGYVEEPPPDPAAPYDFSDSKEALKEPFELRPDQLVEVEQLWELYQNYTPVYTDIDGYITEKELVYMLKALLLMTYTSEQLQELIHYCVRPAHPEGHINYDQFLKMVTLRQRDFPIEDELRAALQVLDPEKTGSMDRAQLRELLSTKGHKMSEKQLNNLMKEVDISNDGTIGVEDVVGTMCIDLNKEDIQMLLASLNPNPPEEIQEDQF